MLHCLYFTYRVSRSRVFSLPPYSWWLKWWGYKSSLIFGGKSSVTSGGCNRISSISGRGLTSDVTVPGPKYWLIPVLNIPYLPFLMLPDLKEDEYTQFSGLTKHLMKYFMCKLKTIFQQFWVFVKENLTKFLGCFGAKSVWVGGERGHIWEANALLHYFWSIDNNNCGILASSWAK